MAASIYIAFAEGRTGKSAVALGVLDALCAEAARVGVFSTVSAAYRTLQVKRGAVLGAGE